MSRRISPKKIVPALVIAILVLSISSQALAAPASRAQPTAPAGSGTINVTPGTSVLPGHAKIGNLRSPPAIVANLTQKVAKQVNDARLNIARKLAEGRIDIIVGQLQLYDRWVANSGLGNEQKANIKAIVDNNVAWFQQQKTDIQAAGDEASVQALADEADQQAATLKVSIKKEAGLMACDVLDGRIAAARNASAGIGDKIAVLNARDNNTAVISNKLADYNAHVDAASVYALAARADFEAITSGDNMDRNFNAGYRQIGLANGEMTQAYADLKTVYLWYLQAGRAK